MCNTPNATRLRCWALHARHLDLVSSLIGLQRCIRYAGLKASPVHHGRFQCPPRRGGPSAFTYHPFRRSSDRQGPVTSAVAINAWQIHASQHCKRQTTEHSGRQVSPDSSPLYINWRHVRNLRTLDATCKSDSYTLAFQSAHCFRYFAG